MTHTHPTGSRAPTRSNLFKIFTLLQPFASYRLAFRLKQVLKSYNDTVCRLKLFVLNLKRHLGGAKTISYASQTISFAAKFKSFARVAESSATANAFTSPHGGEQVRAASSLCRLIVFSMYRRRDSSPKRAMFIAINSIFSYEAAFGTLPSKLYS